MKRLFSIKNVLLCITFTVFLLFIKDNLDIVGNVFSTTAKILTPFIIGFFIAYILNYPFKFFETKVFGKMGQKREFMKKFRKPFSIIITYLLVSALIVVLIWIVVPQIASNISSLISNMPSYINSLMTRIHEFVAFLNERFAIQIDETSALDNIYTQIESYFTNDKLVNIAGETTNAVMNIIMSTTTGLYNFLMGVIISIYFLSAKEQLCGQIKKIAVAYIPIKYLPKVYEIVDITDTKCGRFLVGDIIDAAFVGCLHFVILSLLNIPYTPLISVLVGVTNIIPFFGPIIGTVPSALILVIIDPLSALIFLVINMVIQQLDGNLFKPKIIGSQVGLSSFWVLFSVLVGSALFGIPGMVLGTPIYAVIYYLVRKNVYNKIEDKGKIAKEALEFEVLNYAKIAEEQKRLREERENHQRERIKRLIHLEKFGSSDNESDTDSENKSDKE